ncbi:methyl-accepting chemotaxis protein [Rhizorhabdus argentea]|uniref:methyl-accepting chemotaxis protein n=1 Tax=Rhizorhabdus argentea TaxID=1387174 RepID=UPI0030ED5DCD
MIHATAMRPSPLQDGVLCDALETEAIAASAGLREVIALFRARPELEALPVVDAEGRPIGAVLERDIRKLLLNPFGHALLQNDTLYCRMDEFVSMVPMAEIDAGLAHFFLLISEGNGHDALIVTDGGRFKGAVGGRKLLRMAADREAMTAAQQQARLHMIAGASAAMRAEASLLSHEIAGASDKLQCAARDMSGRAGDAGDKGLSVMAAAAQAADNVGEIAAQGHHLARELDALGGEVAEARTSTARVGQLIEDGGQRARQLSDAASEIGEVVGAIDRIARRINLLALNATIEAARAGDAGRGFAIVAAEVKALARQTSTAAQQVADRIMSVRNGVGSVAAGQVGIESAVAALVGLASTIDEAVMRNAAATQLISAGVRDAAAANDHIRLQAADISATANNVATGSEAVIGIARSLTTGADRLQQRLDRFLEEIGRA